MLKQVVTVSLFGLLAVAGLHTVAGRPMSELVSLFRAGASTTVKSIENEIPDSVHDEKAVTDLAVARERLVDRRIKLNLSKNQLKDLESEIQGLKTDISERAQVLASAYPVLRDAVAEGNAEVTFVSTDFSLNEFRHEVDDLLAAQAREENTLRIKQEGYERLEQSIASGQSALASMKEEMLEIEQQYEMLRTRRDQARMEGETLDLIAGATVSGKVSSADIGNSVDRLKEQVEELEARNAARRVLSPMRERIEARRLPQAFQRLDALKSYAKACEHTQQVVSQPPAKKRITADKSVSHPTAPARPNGGETEPVVVYLNGELARCPN